MALPPTAKSRIADAPLGSPAGGRPALVADRPAAGSDITPLLRGRLLVVALLAALTSGFFSIYRAQLPGQWDYFRASPVGRGLLLFEPVVLATSLVLALMLWRRRQWSLAALRAVEYTFIGFFAVYIGWSQLFAWSGSRFALGGAQGLDTFIVRQAVDSMAGRWVALIVGISTLVPETLRRHGAIVAGLALTAIVVTTWMGASDPLYRPHLGAMLALMTFWMAIASTIAMFGSYKLAELRQQVHEARQLGQYRLVRRIGAGGMGEVFLAEHTLLKQPCAIKLIRPELAANRTAMHRFEREARAISRLEHWNTVQIYDYGYAADGTFYFAMEYLDGLTLQEMVTRHGALPPGRAVHFLRQVCGALREAHGIQLIHRDIKPANVIVCVRAGQLDVAKLLDFGMVRQVGPADLEETATIESVLVGTPAYMSPEQISGDVALDARSDIYSVGAVGYFLLAGVPPFQRDTAVQVLLAHVHDTPAPLVERQPGIPPDVADVIMRCLAKEPADRYADVASLAEALSQCALVNAWTPGDAQTWWSDPRHRPASDAEA